MYTNRVNVDEIVPKKITRIGQFFAEICSFKWLNLTAIPSLRRATLINHQNRTDIIINSKSPGYFWTLHIVQIYVPIDFMYATSQQLYTFVISWRITKIGHRYGFYTNSTSSYNDATYIVHEAYIIKLLTNKCCSIVVLT